MTPSEIILRDKYSQADNPKKVLMGISRIIKSGNGVLLQKNNSVLFLIRLGEGDVELHLYTVDPPQSLASAVQYFIEKIRNSDLKKVYFIKPRSGEQIVKMLQMYGVDIQKSDREQYAYMAKV
jgi:hypothetical protein